MAENKGMLLAKSVQKHAGRAKEKLLQNLGKVDRTADEIFDEHLTNFNRQHTCATRLQKEFSNYIRCVRAVQNASKSLMEAITEVYESQWTGSEVLYGQAKTIDTQYQQFSYKLADQVLKQLDTYALQFPEMKKKIDKRGRKLVDYDSQRHSFQSLQANAAKRKDDLKVTRGREQLEEAKSTYEVLNSELHDELPALYDSRILFLVTNLQTLFACEQQFHSETSKVYAELEAIVDKLATESQRGSYTLKKINANSNPSSPQQSPVKANLSIVNNVTNGSANANGHTSAQSVLPSPRTPSPNHQLDRQADGPEDEDDEPSYQNTEMVKAAAAASASASAATKAPTTNGTTAPDSTAKHGELELNGNGSAPKENGQPAATAVTESVPATTNGTLHHPPSASTNQLPQPDHHHQTHPPTANGLASNARGAQENGVHETTVTGASANAAPTTDVPAATVATTADAAAAAAASANTDAAVPTPTTTGAAAVLQTSAATTDLPPGVLYRVKATYKYVREDVDELSFEVGDVINVVEYEDPEDQEEGWLMGNKEGTNEKGMFPANFTRPL
ncbi:myc box-dependent-interacting protein 1 isoform X3 [Anopheles gambiae]|uniref:myc box-dependent-interacting protein 1 isoform X3 n=1 Tax=Anopheles gambiae TaxID=7165 RepID=UPI002AC9BEF8|nr:myc box-dependent-interacting protein 1 isoform X3 [Anopheles gambiae]XP_061497484.1 myc box-dependent-interacting protein 1 isoform X3 [Anopheles gambiae]XP_061497485.1 myc box-dependent-interacting protein 1 isoform X3 [Anopheles gambiae]